jgi:hypothetical protein
MKDDEIDIAYNTQIRSESCIQDFGRKPSEEERN